jgi:plastocyanin
MRLSHLLVAAVVVTLPACGEPTGPGFVSVYDNSFSPTTVHPAANGVVTWVWSGGSNPHNVIFDDGVGNSITTTSGTHTRDFTGAAAGTYGYRCSLHVAMVGQVVVP